jgi:hypothetical protein
MLETISNRALDVEITDSTVTVLPGTVRVGNTVMKYPGGQVQLSGIAKYSSSDSSKYQYAALSVHDFYGAADLTSNTSTPQSALRSLSFPTIPTDATMHTVGLFTLYSADTTAVSLVDFSRVV